MSALKAACLKESPTLVKSVVKLAGPHLTSFPLVALLDAAVAAYSSVINMHKTHPPLSEASREPSKIKTLY